MSPTQQHALVIALAALSAALAAVIAADPTSLGLPPVARAWAAVAMAALHAVNAFLPPLNRG